MGLARVREGDSAIARERESASSQAGKVVRMANLPILRFKKIGKFARPQTPIYEDLRKFASL
jgi:hypothetical protein